jgi:hypothetical protein
MFAKEKLFLIAGIIFIFLTSLLSLTWFEKDLVYSSGDFSFNFSPQTIIERFLFTWDDGISLGVPNFQNFQNLFPYQLFLYFWSLLGWPLYLAQRLLFWSVFALSGLSMFFLVLTISKSPQRFLWALFSGLFYMMNPFTLVILWRIVTKLIFFYPLIPLLVLFYIKLLEKPKRPFLFIFLFIFTSLWATTAFSVSTYAAALWILILFYCLFYLGFVPHRASSRKNIILKTGLLFLVWLLVNSFWLLPYGSEASTIARDASNNQAFTSPAKALIGASRKAGLSNTFRLFGYNVFGESFMNIDPFYPYAQTYFSPGFVFLSFLPVLLIFLSFLFVRREKNKKTRFFLLFFMAFALLTLFFFKGTNSPLGWLYIKLAEIFPMIMVAFRNPIDKIGPLVAFSFSVLFGFSVSRLAFLFKNWKRAIPPFLVFILVFSVFLFPFWQGKVFRSEGKIYRSAQVKVPDSYWQAADWLKGQKENFRLFPIPYAGFFGLPLDWEAGYDAANPGTLIFDKPLVFIGEEGSLARRAWSIINKSEISSEKFSELRKILVALQVKYIVLYEDVVKDYFSVDGIAVERITENLEKEPFVLAKSFGKLKFYRFQDPDFLPTIFLSEGGAGWELAEDTSLVTLVDHKRLSPTRWLVNLKKPARHFYLVFLQQKDPRWQAFLLPNKKSPRLSLQTLFPRPLKKETHLTIFDYANAWEINLPPDGQHQIVLKFWPQRIFYLGLVITFISLIGLLSAVIIEATRKNSKKNG